MGSKDVFLSHHVSSINSIARKFEDELDKLDITTFLCTSVRPGQDYRRLLTINAVKCKVFIAFINNAWAKSNECTNEFNCALSSFNKTLHPIIIPIVIGGFDWIYDSIEEYPDAFNIISNFQCETLQDNDWEDVFQRVLRIIRKEINVKVKGIT